MKFLLLLLVLINYSTAFYFAIVKPDTTQATYYMVCAIFWMFPVISIRITEEFKKNAR